MVPNIYLGTFPHPVSVCVEPRIHGRLFATGANGLDLDKLFGPRQQIATALKRLPLKVGAEAVGENGDVQFITDQGELEYLCLGTELSLIDKNAVEVFVFGEP